MGKPDAYVDRDVMQNRIVRESLELRGMIG